MDSFPVVEK
jgi:hypothetical protein